MAHGQNACQVIRCLLVWKGIQYWTHQQKYPVVHPWKLTWSTLKNTQLFKGKSSSKLPIFLASRFTLIFLKFNEWKLKIWFTSKRFISIFQGYDFSRVNNAVWTSNEDPDMSGPDFLEVFVGEVYEEFPSKMPTNFPGWSKTTVAYPP